MDPAHAAQDGNPKPGTVVDRGATAVYEYDFYLQAHGGECTRVGILCSLQTYNPTASVNRTRRVDTTDTLLRCPRRDRHRRGPIAGPDERRQLHVRSRDQGRQFGVACVLC